jgi:hypothetical protein
MGCKQYARMLGLSRAYPYILYLTRSKWDSSSGASVFHKCQKLLARGFRAIHIDKLAPAHADIPTRATAGPFMSEIGIFPVVGRGDSFSIASPIAT